MKNGMKILKKRLKCTYQNGNKSGPYKEWYENGQIKVERYYKYGHEKQYRPHKEWYENGQIKVSR